MPSAKQIAYEMRAEGWGPDTKEASRRGCRSLARFLKEFSIADSVAGPKPKLDARRHHIQFRVSAEVLRKLGDSPSKAAQKIVENAVRPKRRKKSSRARK